MITTCCGEPGCAHAPAAPTERPAALDAACCDRWPFCGGDGGTCCNRAPTVRLPRCTCGGALDATHRCPAVVTVADVVALGRAYHAALAQLSAVDRDAARRALIADAAAPALARLHQTDATPGDLSP